MNRGMLRRLKRGMVWLLTALLVLGVLAGCGGNPGSTAPARQSSQAVTETGSQVSAEAGQKTAEASQEAEADETEPSSQEADETRQSPDGASLDEHGSYTSKDQVALYLHTYGRLPDNYLTKKEAENLGWDSKKGNLWEVAPGMSIGGSYFGNYEGKLPEKKGRKYYECDINYEGGYRGAERIIYSDDGLIFYTGDHYENFEQLYPE